MTNTSVLEGEGQGKSNNTPIKEGKSKKHPLH